MRPRPRHHKCQPNLNPKTLSKGIFVARNHVMYLSSPGQSTFILWSYLFTLGSSYRSHFRSFAALVKSHISHVYHSTLTFLTDPLHAD